MATATKTTKKKKTAAKTKTAKTKMVYYFGQTKTDGNAKQRELLGGKGANLADMTSIGLPVPPGFTCTTECCDQYYQQGRKLPAGLMDQVHAAVKTLEKETGKKFGSNTDPLLVSVRSGAAQSMPGMMDTVLNLGLTDESVVGLANATGNQRFAYDAYRRLLNMYGDVVMGVDHHAFEHEFDKIKKSQGVSVDTDVDADGLMKLCDAYKKVIKKHTGKDFPQDPMKQLEMGITAVFSSWMVPRAIRYRQINEMT
ncbi:MAG: PEP/pyruvate-binding domain-containing protein, partial [Planctomycetota bacterium]